ncbi:nucleotidyltransferase family protein [Bacteroides bouchesdurhonensis]
MEYTTNHCKLRGILPKKYNQLLSLLQYLFSGSPVNKMLFEDMSGCEWEELWALASDQGVMVISLEGIKNSDIKPNEIVLMKWFGYVNIIENKYKKHLTLAKELTDFWAHKGIKTMVFKGLALCQYYPNPSQREFGDIVIFSTLIEI